MGEVKIDIPAQVIFFVWQIWLLYQTKTKNNNNNYDNRRHGRGQELYSSTAEYGCCKEKIPRVRNCPDVTILNSLFGLCLSFFCLFILLSFSLFDSFCLFVFLSFCIFYLFVFLPFCLFVFLSFLSFCLDITMSEGSQISKVTLCVKIQKWHWVSQSVSDSLTKVRYRAARAAKKKEIIKEKAKYFTWYFRF